MLAISTGAAILAGGRARRFGGQDKSRLIVRGRTIIVRQMEILQRVADEIFVVGAEPGRFADLALPSYPDARTGLGVIGGIATALSVARADRVVVVACDLPFLDTALLQRLVMLSDGADGAWVRTARGPEPLLACYRRAALPAIQASIEGGRLKAADLGGVLNIREIAEPELSEFGAVDRLLANLNTPDDHRRVE
jgi:molybdopterin-guanine dinucleotide biosynthesis protein A